MTADEAPTRLDRFRRFSLEAATGIVIRHRPIACGRALPSLLWATALVGLLLLPVDYRAGAEHAHAHSLLQLWADAADGRVHHHARAGIDWLDPAVDAPEAAGFAAAGESKPDVGEQQDSAPAAGGLHLLLSALDALPIVSVARRPAVSLAHPLAGLFPPIPVPPPRAAVAA
jgi:hypothetical protein